jgi:lipopolysaccharide export system permease protein
LRLQRYIFGILLKNFLLILVMVTTVGFMGVVGQNLGKYSEVSLGQLLGRFPFLMPSSLTISLPLAILVATLITYGRLSADNEIQAVRMGGINPMHAISPALVLGLIVTAVALVMSAGIAPAAARRARAVTADDLTNFLDNLEEQRVTRFATRNVWMSWSEVDEEGWLTSFFFKVIPLGRVPVLGEAERARVTRDEKMTRLTFELEDATIVQGELENRISTERTRLSYEVEQLFDYANRSRRRPLIDSFELRYEIHRDTAIRHRLVGPHARVGDLVKHNVEYWKRLAQSTACIVFVLVGAPLGILFRKGSFVGAAMVALLLAFGVFYPLQELGKGVATEGAVSPPLAMMFPGLLLSALGIVLLVRVVRR